MTTATLEMTKWGPGCYRIRKGGELFGQIHHDHPDFPRKWVAEIRYTETGNLRQYAGIWNTLKEAREEVEFILSRY